jgi:uncharacterized membrane protein
MRAALLWILWNLFLAALPVGLGPAAAALARRMRQGRDRRLWLLLGPLLFLWLIFLPNSCYLFTELRHFLAAVDRHDLWFRARGDRWALVELLLRGGVGALYTVAGALTFGLAIRPVRQVVRAEGGYPRLLEGLFFVLVALGVYLGLEVRYNSWDLLTRAGEVLQTVISVFTRPVLASGIVIFGLLLWAVYEVVDIWLDGFALRWARWTGTNLLSAAARGPETRAHGDASGCGAPAAADLPRGKAPRP